MKEIKHLRERYGGGDGQAISRHSRRYYRSDCGDFYAIDRELSSIPNTWSLLELRGDPDKERSGDWYIPKCRDLGGQRGWSAAEQHARQLITNLEHEGNAE